MVDRLYPCDDFEATICIYSAAEGGRRTPVYNGIRWDFAYAEENPPDTLYMIWPDFFAAGGRSLLTDQPLPVGVELSARMGVVMDDMRAEVHRDRIAPGVRFFCYEGGRRVAEGVVTRITGLFAPRPSQDAEPGAAADRRGRVGFAGVTGVSAPAAAELCRSAGQRDSGIESRSIARLAGTSLGPSPGSRDRVAVFHPAWMKDQVVILRIEMRGSNKNAKGKRHCGQASRTRRCT